MTSKYSMVHEGKVYPWSFVLPKSSDLTIYNFYVGKLLLGQIFKMSATNWCLVSTISGVQVRHISGFGSRLAAADHAIIIFKHMNPTVAPYIIDGL
jgi:hypothetical protein